MSTLRTYILLAGMTALFIGVGFMIGGEQGMIIAFVIALAMNVFAYWNSDKMVLSMYGAKEVDRSSSPEFYGLVENLAGNAQLPMPKVYIIDEAQPNAFATGRNPENAAVAATTGLLKILSRDEIGGVMAHELAHVKNRDTLIMTITATIAGAISMLANFAFFFGGHSRNNPLGMVGSLLLMILAPMAAMLVQMAISRTREYQADRIGAEICGQPQALASALEKLEQGAEHIENEAAEEHPATAHLFIINPLHSHSIDSLFSTHPNTANRVQKLRDMAGQFGGQSPRQRSTGRSSSMIPPTENKETKGPWG